ncbi:hypothetical protein Hanom_Chr17g01553461 [Helianthus anomalus]
MPVNPNTSSSDFFFPTIPFSSDFPFNPTVTYQPHQISIFISEIKNPKKYKEPR